MSEYERGMSDSQSGIPAPENASDDYIEGYGLLHECPNLASLENFEETWAAL